MPNFAYSGRTRAGQTVSGERIADTMDAAVSALRREQINVTRITPQATKAATGSTATICCTDPCLLYWRLRISVIPCARGWLI